MAGLLHLFDFNQENIVKKNKNDAGAAGFEAPRNSLEVELPAESLQSFYSAEGYEPHPNGGGQSMSRSSSSSSAASVKKLIKEEISRGSYQKQNMPSIVARLMGMDVFPSNTAGQHPVKKNDKNQVIGDVKRQIMDKVPSTGRLIKKSKSSMGKKFRFSYKDAYAHLWSSGSKLGKPRPRVHPQEKELQKFKKDFEAWQAARFLECARVVEFSNIPDQWLAQLDLNKEKMLAYQSARKQTLEKTKALKSDMLRSMSFNGEGLKQHGSKMDPFPAKQKNLNSFRKKSTGEDIDRPSMVDLDQNSDKCSTPTRIVILKPGPDSFTSNDESWVSSSGSLEDRDNIEDLLEEVKERLKSELRGKVHRKGVMVRGGGIETPFKEKPLYPNQRPQHCSTQVRGKCTGDSGRRLFRSESMRSYRSEIHAPEPSSPEFISSYTRNLLSEQLRNVINGDNHHRIPTVSISSSSPTYYDDTRGRLEQVRNILNARNEWNDWKDSSCGVDAQARSFRHDFQQERFQDEASPRKLVRSLSAPISGTVFGKLLLEDRHVLAGVQIKRKHESLECTRSELKSQKKERFNFREKVSNIKHNFTLRKKIFSRKLQSADLSLTSECDLVKEFVDRLSMSVDPNDRYDNFTEVPPSPASVCSSSAQEDLWKPLDHPSPISTSDITSVGDQSVGNVFREISSNLNELRKQLNQLDYEGSEVTTLTEEHLEAALEDLEDEGEAYVRDLLVASGIYDGPADGYLSRWDPYVKHIGDWVFDKVEESYRKSYSENGEPSDEDRYERSLHHKVLFDLSNEAVSRVLGPPMTLSKFRRKLFGDAMVPPPRGRKLLDKVWELTCHYMHPSPDNAFGSLDEMVVHDLDFTPWLSLVDEELKIFGKELEARITAELIEEVIKDVERCAITS